MKKKLAYTAMFATVLVFTTFSGQFITIASGEDFDLLYEDGYEDEDIVQDDEDDANDSGYHRADPTDWGAASELIAAALQTPGVQNVNILTGDSIHVPADVLRNISGKNITLALHAGNGLAFSITGKNVANADGDFWLTLIHPTIPEYIKTELLANASASYIFNMKERTPYPFPVNAHANLGAENAGKVAMLYSYIEADHSLRLMDTFRVTESGQAMFAIQQGGEYIIVVADGVSGYLVREGDTFSHIALRHKVTINALQAANPQIANISKIRAGQSINIPLR